MPSQEAEYNGAPNPKKGELKSPFIEEDFYHEGLNAEWQPRLELLEKESPFAHALEIFSGLVTETKDFQSDSLEAEVNEISEFETDFLSYDPDSEEALDRREEEWYEGPTVEESYYDTETEEWEPEVRFEGDLPPENLTWENGTSAQIDFMHKVYRMQIALAKAKGLRFVASVPKTQLDTIERPQPHKARIKAAAAARDLLAAARAELDRQQKANMPHARKVQSIYVNSGYRDANRQFSIWQNKFPDYYWETKNERIRAGRKDGKGEHGNAAALVLVRYISGKVAAPGYSMHNDGLAIDFGTKEGNVVIPVSTKLKNRKLWEKTWLFNWLMKNAANFGFYPLKSEPWHWYFKEDSKMKKEYNVQEYFDTENPIRFNELEESRIEIPAIKTKSGPKLILTYNFKPNKLGDNEKIDVVVHLHGYSNQLNEMNLAVHKEWQKSNKRDKGRHWFFPPSGEPSIERKTLGILPRGKYLGYKIFKDEKGEPIKIGIYKFPDLYGSGFEKLIEYSLKQINPKIDIKNMGRLVLTAHSGGGEALINIIKSLNKSNEIFIDEIHTFDALYGNPLVLINWVKNRITIEAIKGKKGALRVLYRRGTACQSLKVHSEIDKELKKYPQFPDLKNRYRVQRTEISHKDIPYVFGPALLANSSTDFEKKYTFDPVKSDCKPKKIEREHSEIGLQYLDHNVTEKSLDECYDQIEGEELYPEPDSYSSVEETESHEEHLFPWSDEESDERSFIDEKDESLEDLDEEDRDSFDLLEVEEREGVEIDDKEALFDYNLPENNRVVFPSGESLSVITGPMKKGQEYYDPNKSGNPLLDTSGANQNIRLSKNFTVRELCKSGNIVFEKARIDPRLIEGLQALRDLIGKEIIVKSGFRSYTYNIEVYTRDEKCPTFTSRHISGQAVDIGIPGMTGVEIAKAAIDSFGCAIGIGIAKTYAHIDVRGKWAVWTYCNLKKVGKEGEACRNSLKEIQAYRKEKCRT